LKLDRPDEVVDHKSGDWPQELSLEEINNAIQLMWEQWNENPQARSLMQWFRCVEERNRWPRNKALGDIEATLDFTRKVLDHIRETVYRISPWDTEIFALSPYPTKTALVPRRISTTRTKERDLHNFIYLFRSVPFIPSKALRDEILKELDRLSGKIFGESETILACINQGATTIPKIKDAIQSLKVASNHNIPLYPGMVVGYTEAKLEKVEVQGEDVILTLRRFNGEQYTVPYKDIQDGIH
jgi:hypothetical protein